MLASGRRPPLVPPRPFVYMMSRVAVPKIGKTVLLVCDIQEVFRDIIHGMPSLIKTSEFLVASTTALNVPIVVTEQYPKAMQHTVSELSSIYTQADAARTAAGIPFTPTAVFEKTRFSMCTEQVTAHLQSLQVESVVICGIEAHICVLQTCLDLLAQGIQVHVPVDAVSSTRSFDRTVALKRLEASGATLTTSESVIFQLLEDSKHAQFRSISKLIKEHGVYSQQHELSHL